MGNAAQAHLDGTLADFNEKGGPGSGPRPGGGGRKDPNAQTPKPIRERADDIKREGAARLAARLASMNDPSEENRVAQNRAEHRYEEAKRGMLYVPKS